MRDAIGGVFTIQIILVFLVIINAYLAFSVNYTKAFRIKNNIVSILEQQEGFTEDAKTKIETLMLNSGYNISQDVLNSCSKLPGYYAVSNQAGGFCLKLTRNNESGYSGGYYSVRTFISIDVPILNKVLPAFANVFAIDGETKTIYSDKLTDLNQ